MVDQSTPSGTYLLIIFFGVFFAVVPGWVAPLAYFQAAACVRCTTVLY